MKVELSLGDTKEKLNNDFSIFFVAFDRDSAKYIIQPIIKDNSFTLPDFKGFKEGSIIFKQGKTIIGCVISYKFGQAMTLKFGFDKKPFHQNYDAPDINDKDVCAIAYIEFLPKAGDGSVTSVCIRNLDRYLNFCKYLIK